MNAPAVSLRLILPLLLCALLLGGCGYGFSPQGPSVLRTEQGKGKSTLAVGQVKNPTLETWMEPALRNALRDEIAVREPVRWVEPSEADMLLDLDITRYTVSAAVQDAKDSTLKYKLELVLDATLKDRGQGTVIWRSGPVSRIEY